MSAYLRFLVKSVEAGRILTQRRIIFANFKNYVELKLFDRSWLNAVNRKRFLPVKFKGVASYQLIREASFDQVGKV